MAENSRSHGRVSVRPVLKPRPLMDGPPEVAGVWTARVITLFPTAFPGVLGESLTGKALKDGLWNLQTVELRRFGKGRHHDVDDTPAGGGAGMVLRADVLGDAIDDAMQGTPEDRTSWPLICLSPRGKPFTQAKARALSEAKGITLLCGRFEGIDQRVLDAYQIEEISLGDFVMSGGEIAAQAIIDASVRLLPSVLGNAQSAEDESFSAGLLEYPQYTRPAVWRGHDIPEILRSGHHGNIATWRQQQSEELTKKRRPDLWEAYCRKKEKPDEST